MSFDVFLYAVSFLAGTGFSVLAYQKALSKYFLAEAEDLLDALRYAELHSTPEELHTIQGFLCSAGFPATTEELQEERPSL